MGVIHLETKFNIGDTVYLKTDTDQIPRLVTGYNVRAGGVSTYNLSQGTSDTWHYVFEISAEKNVLVQLNNP